MKLGVFVHLSEKIDEEFERIKENGFSTCQLNVWSDDLKTDYYADLVNKAKEKYGIEITALWCGWEGPARWNFYEGPLTLGLVPVAYRYKRMKNLIKGSDFAKKIGVSDLVTHVGFLPENPNTTEFHEVVSAIREVAKYCKKNGQYFLFETGQETPVTLRRTIEEVGTGNLGINLDPANLILYGKANPVDALDVFGEFVRGVHAKDAVYPVNGYDLGEEKPIGEGLVNFPALIKKLHSLGFDGALTIEREISGEEQIRDIMAAKALLEKLILKFE